MRFSAAKFVPACVLVLAAIAPSSSRLDADDKPKTRIAIVDGFWEINGEATHAGSSAEGLLVNVRMLNATFEDANPKTSPKGFDADANTAAFIAAIPEYVRHGVNAFTIGLQGGDPGYEGAKTSAFAPDGSLRPDYMKRVARVIDACDAQGVAVILSFFDPKQDEILEDGTAIVRGATAVAGWIKEKGCTNVIVDVASGFLDPGYDHDALRDPVALADVIASVKKACPGLLVAASGVGNGRTSHQVGNASDFILLQFSKIPAGQIQARVTSASKYVKAIVCNADEKTGDNAIASAQAAVDSLCSWGYSNVGKNQHAPFAFEGAKDDPALYAKLKELTTK